jgi:hypothetical protein
MIGGAKKGAKTRKASSRAKSVKAKSAKAKSVKTPTINRSKNIELAETLDKNPVFKTWVAKTKRLSKTPIKQNKAEDLCQQGDGFCEGHLGFPRIVMPQTGDASIFARKLRSQFGIPFSRQVVNAQSLRPSQQEINKMKVAGILQAIRDKQMKDDSILVSRDNYIIDGHHRWAAYKAHDPNSRIRIVMMDAPARLVIGAAMAAGAETQRFG